MPNFRFYANLDANDDNHVINNNKIIEIKRERVKKNAHRFNVEFGLPYTLDRH